MAESLRCDLSPCSVVFAHPVPEDGGFVKKVLLTRLHGCEHVHHKGKVGDAFFPATDDIPLCIENLVGETEARRIDLLDVANIRIEPISPWLNIPCHVDVGEVDDKCLIVTEVFAGSA